MNIYQDAANDAKETQTAGFSERRLWSAVLLQALDDWNSGNMRHHKAAEKFFFECPEDFARVCRGAGLAPNSVVTRLRRMKKSAQRHSVSHFGQMMPTALEAR